MKSKFNLSWKKSKQPRKQRKYLANSPNHLKHKEMCAHLDKPLRVKYGTRSIEIRKNDEAVVMRGKFKNKKAKVSKVDISLGKVQLEGVNLPRKDGESVSLWFYPSNLRIVKLEDGDIRRFKNLKKVEKVKLNKDSEKSSENKSLEGEKK